MALTSVNRQTDWNGWAIISGMEAADRRVTEATASREGVIITFDDGKCAVYSASLLLEMFPHAQQVLERPDFESGPLADGVS